MTQKSAVTAREKVAVIPDDVQRRAADPAYSVWVSASAGSGKTKVLTDRLLRLLLAGTQPHCILCLTFTKAAASVMAMRLSERLSKWAVAPGHELKQDLGSLLGRNPGDDEVTTARRLFSAVVDAPGGINIMTIHAFCSAVLGRFPLEAGLTPNFTALDETQAQHFLIRARDDVLAAAGREPLTPEGQALALIAAAQSEEGFDRLLLDIVKERRQLERLLEQQGGAEGVYRAACRIVGIEYGADEKTLLRAGCDNAAFNYTILRRACRALAEGTEKTDQPKARELQAWLDSPPDVRISGYEDYKRIFLTNENEVRENQMTKNLAARHPEENSAMRKEADRLLALEEKLRAAKCARLTHALMLTGRAVLLRYSQIKEDRAALDFDDLINKTRDLLGRNNMAGWIMFKLDGGLDHILVDEGQDTNPEQWDIIRSLCDDFFSGLGARGDLGRTVFCVGDEKQSIYSFQRADPDKFRAMRSWFSDRVLAAKRQWRNETLDFSFRSTPAVLRFVDAVFSYDEIKQGLGLYDNHDSRRKEDGGLVELWPVFETPGKDDRDAWEYAQTPVDTLDGSARLADHIATVVRKWIDSGEILESKGRPIAPGDIMILLRRRSKFVGQLIRALKTRNIPVSGADRMILKEQLAVQDLLAAAQFSLLPEDDLTLACLLKSPLIGWTDQMLEDVASTRPGTLWEALPEGQLRQWLEQLIARAGAENPYEFFCCLLQEPCPADPKSGQHAMTGRLGLDVLDPLEELLNLSLDYERNGIPSLQGFIQEIEQGDSQIKREQEESGGLVRIMTVHGAKGLQAPIVIMPDTVRASPMPAGNNSDARLLWPDKSGLEVPLWAPRKDFRCAAYETAFAHWQARQEEEYRRLLYVAVTRAEDRLYVAGHTNRKPSKAQHWHDYMLRAFDRLPDSESQPFESPYFYRRDDSPPPTVLRLRNPQIRAVPAAKEKPENSGESILPEGLFSPPRFENHLLRPLAPSRAAGHEPAAASPLEKTGDAYRFRRGIVVHKLLQFLPDLPQQRRYDAALRFVARYAADLPGEVCAEILQETVSILENPRWTCLFGPGSLAEVPVTGIVGGRLVSGQIDRLLVTGDCIWIVDYKTNRPPPVDESGIPALYKTQMKSYRDIVSNIYKNRDVRCFLLWTDGPRMMEVPA